MKSPKVQSNIMTSPKNHSNKFKKTNQNRQVKTHPIFDQLRIEKGLSHFQKQNFEIFQQESPSYRSKSVQKHITNLNDKIVKIAIKQKDYKAAISLLHQLEQFILNQKKQNSKYSKKLFFFQLSVCYYNHALVYQKVQNDQETRIYFQKALKNFELIQGHITNRQQNVSYSIQLAKMQLQYCSILSHNAKHQEAISYAQKSLQKLIQSLRILTVICSQFIQLNHLPQTNSNSKDSRTKIQLINFKKIVTQDAQKILKYLSLMPQPYQLYTQYKSKFDSLMKKIFFWQINLENNQKQLRKQLNSEIKSKVSERNILGLQKGSKLIDQLNMDKLIILQMKLISNGFKKDPFYLLSSPKLTQMAFFASAIYFSLATEMRFSQIDLNLNKLKINEKYQKLNHDERLLKCKMLHMKSIQIAGKFLPQSSNYFRHILDRFNKNFKAIMEQINEESRQQSLKQFQSQKQMLLNEVNSNKLQPSQQYGLVEFKNQSILNSLKDFTNRSGCMSKKKQNLKGKNIQRQKKYTKKQNDKQRSISSNPRNKLLSSQKNANIYGNQKNHLKNNEKKHIRSKSTHSKGF